MRLPVVPPELLGRPFTVADARRAGLSAEQLRGPAWRRLFRGVYVTATTPLSVQLRARAAALVLPPEAVVCRGSAAWLHGIDITPYADNLCVAVPPGSPLPRRDGIDACVMAIPASDVSRQYGVKATTPLRTALDLACQSDVVEATVAVDAILQSRWCTLDELADLVGRQPPRRHIRVVRQVLTLAEPRSESPMETRLRLVLVSGGLPRPRVQYEIVTSGGQFLGRVDLAYPEQRVAIEYDGADHSLTWRQDLRRQQRIEDEGWWIRRYTAADVYQRPAEIVADVQAALRVRTPAA